MQLVRLRDDLLRGHASLASFLRARLHIAQTLCGVFLYERWLRLRRGDRDELMRWLHLYTAAGILLRDTTSCSAATRFIALGFFAAP